MRIDLKNVLEYVYYMNHAVYKHKVYVFLENYKNKQFYMLIWENLVLFLNKKNTIHYYYN